MIPSEFIADTTVEFSIVPKDKKPADGYSYVFKLGGASSLSKNGVIDNETVNFKLDPADSASFVTGIYFYQIFAVKNTDKYLVEQGRIGVSALITGTGAFDGRSVAARILDAIDAVLEGRATSDQQSYAIASGAGSRSLSRIPIPELLQLRKSYAAIVAAELRKENCEGIFKIHKFAFVNP